MADGFARIPNSVLRDENLSPQAKLLYAVGCSYVSNGEALIYPSYKTLGEQCGFSRSTAIRYAKELQDRGLWKIETRQDPETLRFGTNCIRVLGLPDRPEPSVRITPPSVSVTLPGVSVEPPSVRVTPPLVSEGHPKKNHVEQEPLNKQQHAREEIAADDRLPEEFLHGAEKIAEARFGKLTLSSTDLPLLRQWHQDGMTLGLLADMVASKPQAKCFAYFRGMAPEVLQQARSVTVFSPEGNPETGLQALPQSVELWIHKHTEKMAEARAFDRVEEFRQLLKERDERLGCLGLAPSFLAAFKHNNQLAVLSREKYLRDRIACGYYSTPSPSASVLRDGPTPVYA